MALRAGFVRDAGTNLWHSQRNRWTRWRTDTLTLEEDDKKFVVTGRRQDLEAIQQHLRRE